jgi:predicted ArsR family transcriptional regulator
MIDSLPRREREIFEILLSLGEASAAEVRRAMKDAPSHSAVRTMLGRLEAKGLLSHRAEEQTYIYKAGAPARGGARIGVAQLSPHVLRRIGGKCGDGSAGFVEKA